MKLWCLDWVGIDNDCLFVGTSLLALSFQPCLLKIALLSSLSLSISTKFLRFFDTQSALWAFRSAYFKPSCVLAWLLILQLYSREMILSTRILQVYHSGKSSSALVNQKGNSNLPSCITTRGLCIVHTWIHLFSSDFGLVLIHTCRYWCSVMPTSSFASS